MFGIAVLQTKKHPADLELYRGYVPHKNKFQKLSLIMTMNIQKTFYKVADFVNWQKNGQLKLSPEFQRRSVWKSGAKSFLIDTIVRGLPIPIIFLRDKRINLEQFEPIREVVDGQQRLRTVLSFVAPQYLDDFDPAKDSFKVIKNHNPEIAGLTFTELDDETRQKILDYEFDAHILPAKIDDREIIQIFRRMNSTSFSANKQELRNAEFFGEFKTSVYNLAAEQYNRWKGWGLFTDDNISRMSEVELTTECLDIMISNAIAGKTPERLTRLYVTYDEIYPNKEIAEDRFRYVMDYINDNFGQHPKDYIFLRKTLFYTFYAFLYFTLYNSKNLNEQQKPVNIPPEKMAKIKLANERLKNRTAPANILEATDRRTTNPKERGILLEYLNKTYA